MLTNVHGLGAKQVKHVQSNAKKKEKKESKVFEKKNGCENLVFLMS